MGKLLQELIEKEGHKKLINFKGYVWWREDLVKKAVVLAKKEASKTDFKRKLIKQPQRRNLKSSS